MEHQPSLIPLGSLWLSALVALLPLVAVIVLWVWRRKAHWAFLAGLVASLLVAINEFQMPTPMAFAAALEGVAFGVLPVGWLVLAAFFLVKVWNPLQGLSVLRRMVVCQLGRECIRPGGASVLGAVFPYVLLVVSFVVAQLVPAVNSALAATAVDIRWPFLWQENFRNMVFTPYGEPIPVTVYHFRWLNTPGTWLFLVTVVIGLGSRRSPLALGRVFIKELLRLRWVLLAIVWLMAWVFVVYLSGQSTTVGVWLYDSGIRLPFLSLS